MAEIMKKMFLVAFLLLHAESVEGYEFRLLPTNLQDTEGFVEIFYNGSWGLIGNPKFRFSDDTASLLCKKFNLSLFGYGARNIYQENNTFSHFWLQNLECNGNKQSIDECVKTDEFNRTQYIKYINDVGVRLLDYGSTLYCVDYKLMGGLSPNTGMLLAAFSSTQHSMCYQGFDSSAGNVVCKHLRYNGLVAFTEDDPGSIPLFKNKLTCTGIESSLNECTMSNAAIENCTRAVYITCQAVRLTTYNEYNDEGTVEIFYNGSWGYLSYWEYEFNGFNDVTAQFLCKTFGFRNVGFSSDNHLLGEAYLYKNAWSGYLSCNGTEADIMQCEKPSSFKFVPYVRSETNIGPWLYCFDFNIASMRLVNGPNPNEGKVELQIGGRWGSIIMKNRYSYQEKTVGSAVCKFLGDVSEILDSFVTDYFKQTWMSNVFCNRNAKDCTIRAFSDSYLGVKCEDTDQCQSNPCLNNGICVDGYRSYTCNCTERWSGINCEIDMDQCQSNPCLNNGICVDGDRSYTCNCTERWSGINCEIDTDPCQSNPCLNNGTCVDGDRSYTCNCTEKWRGINCEIEVGDQTTLIVVLISLICVLSIALLATVCCCLRYRREHKRTKTDLSNVLGQVGLQNTEEVEAVQTEMEEGHYNEGVYDKLKENTVADVADYLNPVTDVELPRDADGYVKFADNDQSVGYYKLKHTEDYSKLS